MIPKTSTLESSNKENSSLRTSLGKHDRCFSDDFNGIYNVRETSRSTSTLLSKSLTRCESPHSIESLKLIKSASSAPTLVNSTSALGTTYNPSFFRSGRKLEESIATRHLPVLNGHTLFLAPLASPETLDIAAKYSVVKDALMVSQQICEPLHFTRANKNISDEETSMNVKKKEEQTLSSPMLLSHSNTDQSYSPPHVTTSRAPSPGFSTSAPVHCGGISGRKQSSAPKSFNKLFWHQRSTEVRQSLSMKPQIAPKPTMTYSLPGFMCLPALSTTLSANTRESVINAQRIPAQETPEAPILRHSLSVESLLGLMCEKKKKFHFVRKVASSFRIKKSVEKEGSSEKLSHLPVVSSRSLPQSPQSELKSKKLFFASSEKSSVAIPWLPARSPKRIHKANAESVQGVLAQGDTLQTLSHNSDGLPLFLVRCVEYIEKEGGLETEGLYRVPGNQAQLFELEKAFRDKGDVDIVGLDLPVHVVTTAVKNFFSCLSEPLIPSFLHNDIMNCLNESRIVERLQMVMSRLKPVNRNVLKYFTSHLYRVASSPITAMDIPNLSKVLFPTLFRPQFNDFTEMSNGMAKFQQATEIILGNACEIF